MNLFSHALRLSGFKIASAKGELARLNVLSSDGRQNLFSEKKWEIAHFHLKNNGFYQKMLGGNLPKNWEDLPVLTKKDLQKPINQRFSEGFSAKNSYVGKTSGSSGLPFTFAKDNWCHALTWASFFLNYNTRGIDLDTDLQARFYGIPHKGFLRYKERFKDFLSARYRFPIFDLSPAKMDSFLEQFAKKPFAYLNGYTSSILLFAKHLKEKQLLLTDVCPTLKSCITTSEMLFENDRKTIETALGVPVINEYGASETGLIAFENAKKELKIDQNLLLVEILDEQGAVLPFGEKGHIVITSLYNRANPFIRYDIGDLGSMEPTEDGSGLKIKELGGRISDTARLPSGKTVPGLAFYYVTKSVLEKTGNVSEFTVVQNTLDTFTIDYVSRRELNPQELQKLKTAVTDYLEPGLNLKIERKAMLDRSRNGKLRQFKGL